VIVRIGAEPSDEGILIAGILFALDRLPRGALQRAMLTHLARTQKLRGKRARSAALFRLLADVDALHTALGRLSKIGGVAALRPVAKA
jgi:hypothetical protein